MPVVNVAGIAISSFFILFILSRKDRKRADYWLIAINTLMIGFLSVVMLTNRGISVNTFLLQTQIPFYLFPVFLLFAIESFQRKIQPLQFLVFAPAVICTLCIGADIYFIHDYTDPQQLDVLYNDPPFYYHILYKGNQLFFIGVLIWLIRRLAVYKKEIRDNFAFTDTIDLKWLVNACWVFLGLTLISLVTFLLANFDLLPIDAQRSFSIVSAFMVVLIFYLSFHGIRQYSITEYYHIKPEPEPIDSKEKYKNSSLSTSEQETIHSLLVKLFEDASIYQESRLQLQDVADKLQIPSYALSQTINSVAGKPFYDFVNHYRVKYMQKLLEDPTQKRFTILALGVESGFNSKASLNRVFKEHTGLSPSEYQRRHLRK